MWLGAAGSPADVDRLAERVEVAVAERVADMAVIEAARPAGLGGQRGELLGRGVAAGRVVEAAREADGPFRHRIAQQPAHPVDRPLVGGHVVPAEGVDAERRVADERPDVDADRAVVALEVRADRVPVVVDGRAAVEAAVELDEGEQVLAAVERREPVAVDADDLRGHALADLGLVARLGEDPEAAVAVEVDEPGGDDLAGRVDAAPDVGGLRGGRVQDPQPLPVDDDAPWPTGGAGPVDDRPAADQEVDAVEHAATVAGWRPAQLAAG